jgi:hypothetical protein
MNPFSRLITRWLRRTRRIWVILSAATASARSPLHVFRSPDILDVSADGTVHVTKSASAAPRRPKVATSANFDNARTQRLARRAAAFLFEYYGFDVVPGQFWPFLEQSFNPGQAMTAFLRAIGCNPDLVRRCDPEELRKASEVVELLVRSGEILHRLPPVARRIVSLQLEFGDYESIRELA